MCVYMYIYIYIYIHIYIDYGGGQQLNMLTYSLDKDYIGICTKLM